MDSLSRRLTELEGCTLCAERFAVTATRHAPRPVAWMGSEARLLICSQAPGLRVHRSGRPFDDPSGVRLRAWLGIDTATFWDRRQVAFLPMAFCFPGHDLRGGDLPPPPICAETWGQKLLNELPHVRLTLLIGQHAHRWHLGKAAMGQGLAATIRGWQDRSTDILALPHPSWRNSGWLKRNPWFETEVLPHIRSRVAEALMDE